MKVSRDEMLRQYVDLITEQIFPQKLRLEIERKTLFEGECFMRVFLDDGDQVQIEIIDPYEEFAD